MILFWKELIVVVLKCFQVQENQVSTILKKGKAKILSLNSNTLNELD